MPADITSATESENYLGLGLGASSLVENVRYTNTRQLYAYGEFCDHLQEKSPAEFLKDGEHAVPEDLWIGSCVQEQAQILTKKRADGGIYVSGAADE